MEKSEILEFYKHEDTYLKNTAFKLNFYILYSCAFLLIYSFKEIDTFVNILNKEIIFFIIISILVLILLCSTQLYLSILDNKVTLKIYNFALENNLSDEDKIEIIKCYKKKKIYIKISNFIEYSTFGFVIIVLIETGFLFYNLLYGIVAANKIVP